MFFIEIKVISGVYDLVLHETSHPRRVYRVWYEMKVQSPLFRPMRVIETSGQGAYELTLPSQWHWWILFSMYLCEKECVRDSTPLVAFECLAVDKSFSYQRLFVRVSRMYRIHAYFTCFHDLSMHVREKVYVLNKMTYVIVFRMCQCIEQSSLQTSGGELHMSSMRLF